MLSGSVDPGQTTPEEKQFAIVGVPVKGLAVKYCFKTFQ